MPVSSVQSNASDGMFMFAEYTSEYRSRLHNIQVRFNGGRDWVDPIGEGDSATQISTTKFTSENFSVAVPTEIILVTQGGQVDREDTPLSKVV